MKERLNQRAAAALVVLGLLAGSLSGCGQAQIGEKQAFRLFRRFRSVKLLLIRHAKTSHRCDCFYYTPNPMRCPIGTQILHTNFSSVSGAFLKIKSCISRGACS